jgi:hypothetical protein
MEVGGESGDEKKKKKKNNANGATSTLGRNLEK